AGVAGRLSQIRRVFEPGFEKHIWFDAEVRDAGGKLAGVRSLPVRALSGRIVLKEGVLYYKGFEGKYGLSRLEGLEGIHKGVLSSKGVITLSAKGELDLSELHEQVKAGVFLGDVSRRVVEIVSNLREISGKGRFDVSLRRESKLPHQINGRVFLEDVALYGYDHSVKQMKGEISFSPKEISAKKITALLEGSPVRVQGILSEYLSEKGSFDLRVESPGAKAGVVARFFFDSASLQDPGTIRGGIRYQGSLSSSENREFSGSLDLDGVQLPLEALLQPLRQVSGKVTFDEGKIDFKRVEAHLGETAFNLDGRWRYSKRPQLTFTFDSQDLDLGYLFSQITPETSEWYRNLEAIGKVRIDKGKYEGFEFSDLKTDLSLDRRVWSLINISARSKGGTVNGIASFDDSREVFRFSAEPKVRAVPVHEFLGWFNVGTREITGDVYITGKLGSRGSTAADTKRNLTGKFHLEIKDGIAKRLPVLVKILNVMDLTRWFSLELPDLNQEGIRFRSITADVEVEKGIYSSKNLIIDSDDIGITMAGKFDGPEEVLDAVVALRPFPRLDSVVSYIPLIGPGIAGIKNSILVSSFSVKGPVTDPSISYAPLSTLGESARSFLELPEKLFTIPGTGKK
ncbi:MAG: AsmA-like C-terminal domain-containing protein, partial [Candidatus Binatia bacterium]